MNRFGYEIKDESEFVALKAVAIYNDYSYSFEEWFWSDLQRLGYTLLYFNKENKTRMGLYSPEELMFVPINLLENEKILKEYNKFKSIIE